MPRKLIYQIIVIVISSICLSCETILDTDTSLEKPKLVVNSLFTQDSTWNVSLTWTQNIRDSLGHFGFQPVGEAARVTIYDEHHSPIENLTFRVTDYYPFFAFVGNTAPVFGKAYSIQVELEGEAILKATSYLPPPVPILSVAVDSSLYQSTGDVLLEVVFKDPGDKINYYQVKVLARLNKLSELSLNSVPIDPALKNDYSTSKSLMLSDSHFNGEEYRLRLKVSRFDYSPVKHPVRVVLNSVTEEYYKYFTTQNLQINSRLDPFAQPAEIFSNVENGLGIFAGYGSSVFELK